MSAQSGNRLPGGGARQLVRSQAVTAWRFWETDEFDGRLLLTSPFRSMPWPPGRALEAECFALELRQGKAAARHAAPGETCRCGVYGGSYRSLRQSLRASLSRMTFVPVIGRVQLWGTVRADGGGWRASLAYPEQLLIPTFARCADRLADELRVYDVPVDLLDVRETFSALSPGARLRTAR